MIFTLRAWASVHFRIQGCTWLHYEWVISPLVCILPFTLSSWEFRWLLRRGLFKYLRLVWFCMHGIQFPTDPMMDHFLSSVCVCVLYVLNTSMDQGSTNIAVGTPRDGHLRLVLWGSHRTWGTVAVVTSDPQKNRRRKKEDFTTQKAWHFCWFGQNFGISVGLEVPRRMI